MGVRVANSKQGAPFVRLNVGGWITWMLTSGSLSWLGFGSPGHPSRHAGGISRRIAQASMGVEGGGLRWGNCRDAVGIHQRRRRWRIGASPAATKRGSRREKMVGDELEFCLVKLASHWGSCGNQGISGSNGRAAASPVGCASCFLPGEESGYRCYCGQKLGIAFSVTIDWLVWVSPPASVGVGRRMRRSKCPFWWGHHMPGYNHIINFWFKGETVL